jgi:hypothetical protein
MFSQPNVIGHDPVPSFAFAPTEAVLDTLASATDDAWNLHERLSESRFAPRLVHRVAPVGLQVARFRRGDSTLVVAAYAVSDDSLGHAATASLGATLADGSTLAAPVPDSTRHASLMLPTTPLLAGVDVADTSSYTLARARILFARGVSATSLALSDLLLYRAGHAPVSTLDSALAVAIPGDTVSRARPVGIYWETYGISESGENLEISVTVVRIDRSWLRGARQRFGLAAPDSPLKLHWSDARPPETGGAAPRAISLDLANQEPGRYRVTVSLTRADGAQASSGREIQLRER